MSSAANDLTVDLAAAVDREFVGDVGLPAGAELLAFTNAVQVGTGDIDSTRAALEASVGEEATLQASATIAIFNGLVRVADGTGIPLDSGVFAASADDRSALGIDDFAGAANSSGVRADSSGPAPSRLFG